MLATRAAPPKRAPRPIAPVGYAAPPVDEEEAALAADEEAPELSDEARDETEEEREDSRDEIEELNEEALDEAEEPVPVICDEAAELRDEAADEAADERLEAADETADERLEAPDEAADVMLATLDDASDATEEAPLVAVERAPLADEVIDEITLPWPATVEARARTTTFLNCIFDGFGEGTFWGM